MHCEILLTSLQFDCRCWLNAVSQLLFNSKVLAAFWQAQAAGPPELMIDHTKSASEQRSQLLYWQFVELWGAMQKGTASTRAIWVTLGEEHPSMVDKRFGQWVQQDADEAFSLLLPMLVTGMRLSGVPEQVITLSADVVMICMR